MTPLPRLMVAPNGARRSRSDHPALPVTNEEIVSTAIACAEAGADGLHAHVRDAEGRHVLDVTRYRDLLEALQAAVPDLFVQVTTEAVGRYAPAEQRALVERLQPAAVSVALREMLADGETLAARRFYHDCQDQEIAVQHILYDADDVDRLCRLRANGVIPAGPVQALLVLGRYSDSQIARPEDLPPMLDPLLAGIPDVDWAVCAFGPRETECLVMAHARGGKLRVGFENNLWQSDGTLAADNAARVHDLRAALAAARGESAVTRLQ